MKGRVFSDLGRAAAFLGVDWVRQAIRGRVGIDPWPGTLNLRLCGGALARWEEVRRRGAGVRLPSPDPGFCDAFLYPGFLEGGACAGGARERVAAVAPEVGDYPADKLEIIAAVSLKRTRAVRDGDELTVVFDDRARLPQTDTFTGGETACAASS